jgi:DNA-binding CsgD family transcriptional regulator
VLKPEIYFPKRNARANVTANKYRRQVQWRQNKVQELLAKGYSQKEICSTLHISQPTVSRDILFIKNNYQKEYDTNNTKAKFVSDYFMTQMSFDEIKNNLWEIVDNKKAKDRDKIQSLNQLADITIETLEFIPILEVMLRVNKLNEDLKEREKKILVMEKILKEKEKDKAKLSKDADLKNQ